MTEFDTSCFTGKYVTGETIGDCYFKRIHDLRNDAAQQKRRSGVVVPQIDVNIAKGSDHGCESVHNDQRDSTLNAQTGCEAI